MYSRHLSPPPAILDPAVTRVFALVAVFAGLLVGLAAGLGMPQNLLIAAVLSPFLLVFIYARPHWAVAVYVVLVYADLLSIMVKYHDFPPLARFAGAIMLTAVLGYRVVYRREGLKKDEVTPWLVAYGLVVALGIFYAQKPDAVMPNVVEFVRNFLTYLIIVNSLTTLGRIKVALWGLFGVATLLSTLTLYQTVTGNTDSDFGGLAQFRVSEIFGGSDAARPGGTIGDANYYGQLLLIVVPVGLYLLFESRVLLAKFAALGATTAIMGAIVFTYSRGDAVALVATLFAAVVFKRPRLPVLIVLGIVAAIGISLLPSNYVDRMSTIVGAITGDQTAILTEGSIRGRVGAVSAAVDMFADNMILGVGRENYPVHQLAYLEGSALALNSRAIPPHDLYLEIATEHGIVGIVVFAGLIVVTFGALREARRRFTAAGERNGAELAAWLGIGLFGYLVSSVFLHGAFLYMLWLQIALIVALRQVSRHAEVVDTGPVGVPADEMEPVLPFARPGAPKSYLLPTSLNSPGLLSRLKPLRPTPRSDQATSTPGENGPLSHPQSNGSTGGQLSTIEPTVSNWQANIDEQFRAFYEANGGEPVFGRPISPVFEEAGANGNTVPVQYFEYARLEYRPEAEALQQIVVGKLGLEVAVRGGPVGTLPEALQGERIRVREGGIGVPEVFHSAWQSGGITRFGNPISPLLQETGPGGSPLYVQYFERARFEYHPEHEGTDYAVRRTPLGLQLYRTHYGVTEQS